MAILSTNYITTQLKNHYPILYNNHNNLITHKYILNLHKITQTTKMNINNITKHLINYNFHTPTISFPITKYNTISLQPNTNSQSELTNLLAIQTYHHSQNNNEHNVYLIPTSTHNTNATNTIITNIHIIIIKTTPNKNININNLRAQIQTHHNNLTTIIITYPSTHKIFKNTITKLCALIHNTKNQIYINNANLNTLINLAKPGHFDTNISHLNLHKTFYIPHNNKNPNINPITMHSHLAPFLPNHPLIPNTNPTTNIKPMATTPYNSTSILPIS